MKKQELLKGLTEEQIAKVKACKNQEELIELAKLNIFCTSRNPDKI